MNDNWIVRGPAFNLEDAANRARIERVGGQAVDGLGWQRDRLPGAEELGSLFNRVFKQRRRMRRQNLCRFHGA
jgi:hypothetical protein